MTLGEKLIIAFELLGLSDFRIMKILEKYKKDLEEVSHLSPYKISKYIEEKGWHKEKFPKEQLN